MIWDSDHGSLMFGLPNNIPLEIGLQTNVHVKNTTGSSIPKGRAVYISSADTGMPLVDAARADNDDQIYRLVGITNEAIANNSTGYVTYDGIVSNIDTSAFAVGDELYVSAATAGVLVNVAPETPNNVRVVGYVLSSNATTGRIFVRIGQSSSYDRTLTLTANTPALNFTGAPSVTSTNQGLLNVGALSWSDTNIAAGFAADVNSYAQVVVQNKNAGTTASADFIVSNDTGSASANYGDFGINSSVFTGGGPWNDPAGTYLYANGGTLTLGTQDTSSLKLVVNNVIQSTISTSSATFTGTVVAPAATASLAPLRIPHGTAPSSPTNGDVWTTTAGMYVRVNGSTVGPLGAGGGSTDTISSATGAAATATLFSDVTTGSISVGAGLTTGTLNLAAAGTGATNVNIGHTNAVIGITGNTTLTGTLTTTSTMIGPTPTTSIASLRLPHGTAPSAPTNGDVWTTTSGIYVRVNGSTVGPLGPTGGVSAPLSLSQGSSTPTLTVTQTGPGDALVVEDVASDSTPFRVTSDGRVSINGANLGADDYLTVTGSMAVGGGDLQVIRETGQPRLTVYAAAGAGYYPATVRFARESLSYGATPDNSKIGIFDFTGKTSSGSYIVLGQISVDGGVNGVNGPPTTMSFLVNNAGSLSERLNISNTLFTVTGEASFSGVVSVGTPTANGHAATKLYVDTQAQQVLPFSRSGTLSVATGSADFMFPFAATILGISATVTTAPTGASVILDVDKNGTTIFTNQANRPTIAASATATASEVTNMDITSYAAGDKIRVNVDQVGSTIAGSNLTVMIRYRRT